MNFEKVNTLKKSELVEPKKENHQPPICVTGVLQIKIPTQDKTTKRGIIPQNLSKRDLEIVYMLSKEKSLNRLLEKYVSDMDDKNKEIARLNKILQKRTMIEPEFATTKDAAAYIGTDPSFLTKKMGKVFKEGIHYHKPKGGKIVRWNLGELKKWLTATKEGMESDNTDPQLASLLERSYNVSVS